MIGRKRFHGVFVIFFCFLGSVPFSRLASFTLCFVKIWQNYTSNNQFDVVKYASMKSHIFILFHFEVPF